MLDVDSTLFVVVDMQEKLVPAMLDSDGLVDAFRKILRGAILFDVPLIVTEQVNLGATVSAVLEVVPEAQPITKRSFSCCGEQRFMEALEQAGRRRILLGGIECHICVYQTACDLVSRGYDVQVLADCVSSRTELNRTIGLDRMKAEGVRLTSTEMALFELLRVAEGEAIRALSRLVK